MAPQTGTAILVLVAFVLPGFVALRYRERTYVTRAEETPFERLLNALFFSFLSYLVIFAGALLLRIDEQDVREFYGGDKSLSEYVMFGVAALLAPLLIAESARRWTRSRLRLRVLDWGRVSHAHATPSGWEHFFFKGDLAFVRVTLKDGRVVAGYYGTQSFAGYTAETPDLYLEQRYQLNDDDWFTEPAPGTLGVYVRADEIVSVEFYDAYDSSPQLTEPVKTKLPWWAWAVALWALVQHRRGPKMS